MEGGWSGILDTQPGDSFSWECHVVNKSTGTLVFSNNTYTGEMCILDAEMVGSTCN
jgi:autotransporter-associated beta strand protein